MTTLRRGGGRHIGMGLSQIPLGRCLGKRVNLRPATIATGLRMVALLQKVKGPEIPGPREGGDVRRS